jgi:hypothetical protein
MRESNGRVFDLQKGDLVVTDRANGLRKRLVFVVSKLADIVVRISPSRFPMEDEQGAAICVIDWRKRTASLCRADRESCRLDNFCRQADQAAFGCFASQSGTTGEG